MSFRDPREVAWRALVAWFDHGIFLQESLERDSAALSTRDRALAYQIAGTVCRHHLHLAETVRLWTQRLPPAPVLLAIECGMAQLHLLDRIPPHAAITTSVELARRCLGRSAIGLVNALLRRSQREGLAPLPADPLKALSLRYSFPMWLVHHWRKELPLESLEARLREARERPQHWLRVRTDIPAAQAAAREAGAPEPWWDGSYFCVGENLAPWLSHEGFAQGWWSVQNPSAGVVVKLLDVHPGDRVLDLCAAPGGKTALLQQGAGERRVVAADISARRLQRIEDLTTRLNLIAPLAVAMDGRHPALSVRFDRILLDVPCSNLGVVARRPEVPTRLQPADLQSLPRLQGTLLDGAADLLAPDGVLVYATCSPERAETSAVIQGFLQRHPQWWVEDPRPWVEAHHVVGSEVRIVQAQGWDGFFAVRLRRRGPSD